MNLAAPSTPGHHGFSPAQQAPATKREVDARSAYRAALAAATTSLVRAQRLFEAASAAIDAHIARSLSADTTLALAPARAGA